MRLGFSFYLSAANLRQRKLRSLLTIGGLAVGVSLITFLISLGFGLQQLVRSQVTNVEALSVLDVSQGASNLLKIDDKSVKNFQNISGVVIVSPSISLSGQITRKDQTTDVAVYGVTQEYLDLEGMKLVAGSNFTNQDAKEAIVTSTALNLIGLEDSPTTVGQDVTLRVMVPTTDTTGTVEQVNLVPTDIPMKVRGIIKDPDLTVVYLPLKILEDLGFPASYTEAKVRVGQTTDNKQYNVAKVKVADQSQVPSVRKQIEKMGYQVSSVADTVGQIDKIFLIFEIIVGGFGAIAMFVAAIGTLNTLTVSLLERTREIGLMKAFGATSTDIYQLFLSEAMTMGLVGGVVGVGIGVGAGLGVDAGLKYFATRLGGQAVSVFYTPWQFVALMMAMIVLISLATGFYPARRAATINVLEALRNE